MRVNWRILHAIALLLRIALGGIFVDAAWSKLKDPWALFAMAMDAPFHRGYLAGACFATERCWRARRF